MWLPLNDQVELAEVYYDGGELWICEEVAGWVVEEVWGCIEEEEECEESELIGNEWVLLDEDIIESDVGDVAKGNWSWRKKGADDSDTDGWMTVFWRWKIHSTRFDI